MNTGEAADTLERRLLEWAMLRDSAATPPADRELVAEGTALLREAAVAVGRADRAERQVEKLEAAAQDAVNLLGLLHPWAALNPETRTACTWLTMKLAAVLADVAEEERPQ